MFFKKTRKNTSKTSIFKHFTIYKKKYIRNYLNYTKQFIGKISKSCKIQTDIDYW